LALYPAGENIPNQIRAHLQGLAPDLLAVIVYPGILPPIAQVALVVVEAHQPSFPQEAEALRAAIAYYLASPGPAIPHRILGPLTKAEWDRFELIHLAHHLSFAVPV